MTGEHPDPEVARTVRDVVARGASAHIAASGVADKAGVLGAIGDAMRFPDYYGRTLDALYDMLVDLSWLDAGEHVLIWPGAAALRDADPAAHRAVLAVLDDATRSPLGYPFTVVVLD